MSDHDHNPTSHSISRSPSTSKSKPSSARSSPNPNAYTNTNTNGASTAPTIVTPSELEKGPISNTGNDMAEEEKTNEKQDAKYPGGVKRGLGVDGVEEIVVDWDGPDDVGNPRNWSPHKKWSAVSIISCFTFISPVSSSMIAPAADQLAQEFGITSTVIVAMTISIFVLAYAVGPLFLGPLSEVYGRSKVVQIANLLYLAWNLGCGFAQNKSQLIAFRFLAGLGGSAPLSIGGAVVGDCFTPEHRGQAIAIYSLAPLLGPVLGPIVGAWVAEKSTWRWVFWSTTIADGIVQCMGLLWLRETYAPLLLQWKADKIRNSLTVEEQGRVRVRTVFQKADNKADLKTFIGKALVRPFKLFVLEPIVQLMGVYMAFQYGLLYLAITTLPTIFEDIYSERVGIAGLHYIALGVGLTGFSQLNARSMDKIYVYLKNKNGGVGRPEFRLPAMVPATWITPIGLLIAGWCAQTKQPWIATDIGIVLIGGGSILNFQCIQTYVIDTFSLHAASALAAVTFLRSCAGFGFPLFAPAMYDALGYGKGNTVLAVVGAVIGCPAPFLFWKYGERIRAASRHARK